MNKLFGIIAAGLVALFFPAACIGVYWLGGGEFVRCESLAVAAAFGFLTGAIFAGMTYVMITED